MKIGCVIMASGMARRFGSNKLLHDYLGAPMIDRILSSAKRAGFWDILVVTRHPEVALQAEKAGIRALVHDLPLRSDTVRLGVEALLERSPDLNGVMFAASDQPCLRWESLKKLCDAFQMQPEKIYRLRCGDTVGNPVIFPQWAFGLLRALPEGKGGGAIIKKYPERVDTVEVSDPRELIDVDTPEILQMLLESEETQ